jgi:thymidylate kinase
MLFISTSAEITFAMLFMKFRSKEEVENNVYFASDDPKWVFVNRYTLSIVVIVFIHLIFQSFYALKYF